MQLQHNTATTAYDVEMVLFVLQRLRACPLGCAVSVIVKTVHRQSPVDCQLSVYKDKKDNNELLDALHQYSNV